MTTFQQAPIGSDLSLDGTRVSLSKVSYGRRYFNEELNYDDDDDDDDDDI